MNLASPYNADDLVIVIPCFFEKKDILTSFFPKFIEDVMEAIYNKDKTVKEGKDRENIYKHMYDDISKSFYFDPKISPNELENMFKAVRANDKLFDELPNDGSPENVYNAFKPVYQKTLGKKSIPSGWKEMYKPKEKRKKPIRSGKTKKSKMTEEMITPEMLDAEKEQ